MRIQLLKQRASWNFVIKTFIVMCALAITQIVNASSHREAPLIANDPLADNTDLYAFRSPANPTKIIIIANYIPNELPFGGPNYYSFGENIRYEIHIDNDASIAGDEIIYRFMFSKVNEDPTTFFNIRLGQQNLKTTYILEKSVNGGTSFTSIISNGIVPPPNIGDRSIDDYMLGLGASSYNSLISSATVPATTGETVYCGPSDDPFFADLGGIFDLADAPRQGGGIIRDGLAKRNVHSICLEIDIAALQKTGQPVSAAVNILDPNFVIGVWASASRQTTTTLNTSGGGSTSSGPWVQVSRIGMPLTNQVFIPVGQKDIWNNITPYNELANTTLDEYFYNPEMGLYMDDALFAGAIPAFCGLRIQRNSLQTYDFGNTNNGLFSLKGTSILTGTALDTAIYGNILLPSAGKPRSVDLWPLFFTGIPNMSPYQLATGKSGNPFANGKPFINNFLPSGGDMLRLNMAVPPTLRNDPSFSSLGILQAMVLGLTDPTYNSNTSIQMIPNMDGFPNGRRLEDDVTRIELQAISGIILSGIGFNYDDYTVSSPSYITNGFINVLQYSTGVEQNDTTFKTVFPFVQTPWRGTSTN